MANVGRPRKEIDWELFDKLCEIHCTQAEMCSFFGVDQKTMDARIKEKYGEEMTFRKLFQMKQDAGKVSLRRLQWRAAERGNVQMLIHLGKNLLGQSDKHEVKNKHSGQIDFSGITTEELRKLARKDE